MQTNPAASPTASAGAAADATSAQSFSASAPPVANSVTATAAFDEVRDAAAASAREILNRTISGAGLTNVTADQVTAVLAQLDNANLTGVNLTGVLGSALRDGLEGLRVSGDEDAADSLATLAYKALFETSLGAAGDFIKSQFEGSTMRGASENLTVAELHELVASAIEMAEQNAVSFVDLGISPENYVEVPAGADGNASTRSLSPQAAVDLLDRVQYVLAAARGEFSAALNSGTGGGGGFASAPSAAPDGFFSAAEIIELIGGMTGLPTVPEVGGEEDEMAPGPVGGFPFTARDDTAKLAEDIEFFNGDPLGLLDGGNAAGIEGGDGSVTAQSGPPAGTVGDVDAVAPKMSADGGAVQTNQELPPEPAVAMTPIVPNAGAGSPLILPPAVRAPEPEAMQPETESKGDDKSKAEKAFDRLELQVALPFAALLLAGGIYVAYRSGYCRRGRDGSSGSAEDGVGTGTRGEAEGATGTAEANHGSSKGAVHVANVRRTSTSTRIEMSGNHNASPDDVDVALEESSARTKLEELSTRAKLSTNAAVPVRAEADVGASSSTPA